MHSADAVAQGERFAATVLPAHTSTEPHIVFQQVTDAASADSVEWRSKYPNFNATNLDTTGILVVHGCNYLFVHQKHPVIDLLRVNKDMLGADIDAQQLIDDQYYKVAQQVFQTCCKTLRAKVLSRISTQDLNTFSLQLHRIGTDNWLDMQDGSEIMTGMDAYPTWTPEQRLESEAQYLATALKKPCMFTATLEIEYEIQP